MQQVPETLLAKSKREGRILSLEQHLLDTEQAAGLIFRIDGRWGRNWCRFFELRNRETQEKFLLNLRIAALFHDLGKANEDFYRAVTGFDHRVGHFRPLRMVARILECHIYLRLGRFGLGNRLLGWPTP